MSKTNTATKTKTATNAKPFCKVCQDAGKPESVYTSHFVRSTAQPGGIVTCPTLLALECRFCHKTGHTVKYCTILEERKKMEKKREKQQVRTLRENTPTNKNTEKVYNYNNNNTNVFACLDSDSEDEKEETIDQPTVNVTLTETPVTYASILSKPKPEQELKSVQEPKLEVLPKPDQAPKPDQEPKPKQGNWSFKMPTKSWADWTDSEDEEDLIPPTKPVLRRQPSIMNNEEFDINLLPNEGPKFMRECPKYGMIDSDEDW